MKVFSFLSVFRPLSGKTQLTFSYYNYETVDYNVILTIGNLTLHCRMEQKNLKKLLPKIEDYNKFDFDLCMNKFFDFMYEG